MSKQEKLISADKLLEWLASKMTHAYDDSFFAFESVQEEVEAGTYDPDPVPTIKPGDKVKHEEYGEGWVRSEISERKVWISFHSLDYDMRVPTVDLEVVKGE